MPNSTYLTTLFYKVAASAFSVCLLVSDPLFAATASEAQSPSKQQPGPARSDRTSGARISSQSDPLPMRASIAMDAQIRTLQLKLNMLPTQQILFDALARAMRRNAEEMDGLVAQALTNRPRDAVEIVRTTAQFMNVQSEGIRELLPPLEAFYASLSEEQRRGFDMEFSKLFDVEDP
jgi:hypothetical protein